MCLTFLFALLYFPVPAMATTVNNEWSISESAHSPPIINVEIKKDVLNYSLFSKVLLFTNVNSMMTFEKENCIEPVSGNSRKEVLNVSQALNRNLLLLCFINQINDYKIQKSSKYSFNLYSKNTESLYRYYGNLRFKAFKDNSAFVMVSYWQNKRMFKCV